MSKLKSSIVVASLILGLDALGNVEQLEAVKVVSSTINDETNKSKEVSSVAVIDSKDVEKINPRSVADILIPDYAIEEAIKYLFITKSYRFSL